MEKKGKGEEEEKGEGDGGGAREEWRLGFMEGTQELAKRGEVGQMWQRGGALPPSRHVREGELPCLTAKQRFTTHRYVVA